MTLKKRLLIGSFIALVFSTTPHATDHETQILDLKKTSAAFNAVAKKGQSSVVSISTVTTFPEFDQNLFRDPFGNNRFPFFSPPLHRKKTGMGSGVIVSPDGYILTNNHVVENSDEITVTLTNGKEFPAKRIGSDPKTDLALLKIEATQLPTLKLANSDDIEVGDWAIAVGNPFGLAGTVTVGVISAKGRSDLDFDSYSDFIQTDAAINPGNSGGALLNIDGELMGINTAIYSQNGGYMGIGFAIPSNMALRIMEDLKTDGKVTRGWLGVVVQPITEELQQQFKLETKEGALVNDVLEQSPAEKTGLKRGDVIISFNNKKIHDFKSLRNRVSETPLETTVPIKIIRNSQTIALNITLHPIKAVESETQQFDAFGLTYQNITPELKTMFQLPYTQGVVITNVKPGSGAFRKRIYPGTLVLEANRNDIRSEETLKSISNRSSSLLLLIRQGQETRYVILEK